MPQPVFQAAIAAVGVRMEALHQLLVARLDLLAAFRPLQIQRLEGTAFEIAEGAPRLGLGGLSIGRAAEKADTAKE